MPHLRPLRESTWAVPFCMIGLLAFMMGCAGSGPVAPTARETSAVVGQWSYQTRGTPLLGDGELRIEVRNERLHAVLYDDRRGRLVARVRVDEERVELEVEAIEIAGRVEQGRFTGVVRRPMWDVSTQQATRYGAPSAAGTLVARRLGTPAVLSAPTDYGCTPLLRETSYACSPLP